MSQSKDLFFLLFNRLTEAGIATHEEIGGHSAVWAKRAQIEGCDVFTAAQPTDFTTKNLPNASRSQRHHLIHPTGHLSQMQDTESKKEDIHLVFEYVGGDEILGFRAPRSNRLYFVFDPNGGKFA